MRTLFGSNRERASWAAVVGVLGACLLATSCNDGANLFSQVLEPGPIFPSVAAATTSPVADLSAQGTALPQPTVPVAANGLAGLTVATLDQGQNSGQTSVEEGDLLVCDPGAQRVLLLKARAHDLGGLAAPALDFLSVSNGDAVQQCRGVIFLDTVNGTRLAVATANGYSVFDADGGVKSTNNGLTGAPYTQIAVNAEQTAFFFAGGTGGDEIYRVGILQDGSGNLAVDGAATLVFTASAAVNGLLGGRNDDLHFTEAPNKLRRLPNATASDGSVVLDTFTFGVGDAVGGMALNSEDNLLCAIDDGANTGRIDEIDLGAGANPTSTVSLPAPAQSVVIDARHAALFWSTPGDGNTIGQGVQVNLPPKPDLGEHLQASIFEARDCAGCHPVINASPDLSSAQKTFDTTVDVLASPASGGLDLVEPGDSANSALVQKLRAPAPYGARMPQNLRPIPSVEIDLIELWILGGADPAAAAP